MMFALLHSHKDELAHLAGCHLESPWKSQDPVQVGPAAVVVKDHPDDADNLVSGDVLRRREPKEQSTLHASAQTGSHHLLIRSSLASMHTVQQLGPSKQVAVATAKQQ